MNRKLILLNLALVALAGALGWQVRQHWLQEAARERAIFEQAARVKAQIPPPPIASPGPISPAEYIEVAQKTVFSKDRNPTVAIEPPPPPKPDPPMPALPVYHGQMSLGEPVVVLSTAANTPQKSYRVGEKVGPFEIVSFDHSKIILGWEGKTVERVLQDLAPKDANPAPQQAVAQAASAPAPPRAAATSLTGAPDGEKEKKNPALGVPLGNDFFACAPGESSPSGTVKDGYKKIISASPFGQSCHWELVQ